MLDDADALAREVTQLKTKIAMGGSTGAATDETIDVGGVKLARRKVADLDKDALRQEVYIEPLETSNLFAASTPVSYELDNVNPGTPSLPGRLGQNEEVRYQHYAGLRYVAWSDPKTPPDSMNVQSSFDRAE